jgi:hypothetical protein
VNESSRKVALVVGAIAAAAGVAVASYVYFGNGRRKSHPVERLRNVSEVLSDCYTKIKELQQHVAELRPAKLETSKS